MSNTTTEPSEPAPKTKGPLLQRALRLAPILSLAIAVTSTIIMRRSPERAPLILAIAVAGWLFLLLTQVALKKLDDDTRRSKVMRFVALWLSQYAVQTSLAFPLPFFARAMWPPASGYVPQHAPFAIAYVVAVVVSFWDPLYARVARKPALLVALQGFAAFVACLTVLPIAGLDNAQSFVVAGVVVATGAPLWFWLTGVRSKKRGSFSSIAALSLAILVVVGAPLVPPAPLSLERAVLAEAVVDKEAVGASAVFSVSSVVVCHTAIRAPLGLSDKLLHVWSVDGREIQRVSLDVSGGRAGGFRTWSRLQSAPRGRLACRIETALGQVVGRATAHVH